YQADVGGRPLGELDEVRHSADHSVVRLQGLQGLNHLIERLVRVEGAEALIDEQALQCLAPVCAGAEIGQALGERQGQGERGQERLASAERLDGPHGVRVPAIDDLKVQAV